MNLRLLQISDSALPIGGYTHSWGLEAALARGLVRDVEALEHWTRAWLRFSLAPFEGVVVAAVCRATALSPLAPLGRGIGGKGVVPAAGLLPAGIKPAARLDPPLVSKANDLVGAGLAPPSVRAASREMGEQLLSLSSTWAWSRGPATRLEALAVGWHHAVVFGFLGAVAGAGPVETLTAYLHQAVLGMIAAGVRAVPVGHTHGQQVLAYLHPDIQELAGALADRDLDTAGAGCPFYEVLCDEQTRLYTRLFRS
jgi:urease accessory protein